MAVMTSVCATNEKCSPWETRKKAFLVAAHFHLATKMHARLSSMLCFQFRQLTQHENGEFELNFPSWDFIVWVGTRGKFETKCCWNLFGNDFNVLFWEKCSDNIYWWRCFSVLLKVRSISWQLRHGKMKMLWENEMLCSAPIDSRPSW